MNEFVKLGITAELAKALENKGINVPTAIQRIFIPALLKGEQLIGDAPTGTGKTLAYLLPIISRLDIALKSPQAVIVAPTYELAMQIVAVAKELISIANIDVKILGLIGDANIKRQLEALKKNKPHVIVGSVGRVNELVQLGKLKLSNVRFLVLDEFDRLLGKEQLGDMGTLLKALPAYRQNLFLSATASKSAIEQAKRITAVRHIIIRADSANRKVETVEHFYAITSFRDKLKTLKSLTNRLGIVRGLVFVSSSYEAKKVSQRLTYEGINNVVLSGMDRKENRKNAINAFRSGRVTLMIATDLAARGLDIEDIDYVLQYSLPDDVRAYRHRAGRTGRAGKSGKVITLVDNKELVRIKLLGEKMRLKLSTLSAAKNVGENFNTKIKSPPKHSI